MRTLWAGYQALLLGCLIALTACVSAQQAGQDQAPVSDSAATPLQGQQYPAMWRVSDADTQIYLFGTFHLLPEGLDWISPAMRAAMAATNVTYFEADTTSERASRELQAAILEHGVNPPGVTLSSLLGDVRAARFATIAEGYGIPMESLETMRPWLASLQVTLTAYSQLGFAPGAGAETVIQELAKSQNDRLAYLENGADQIAAFASVEEQDEFASFDDGISQLIDPSPQILRLLEAWQTGDVDAIEAEITLAVRDASPATYQILFIDRNNDWTRTLTALMEGEGDYFVAVGAGHLVGEGSVVDMLRSGGYSVTRIQ